MPQLNTKRLYFGATDTFTGGHNKIICVDDTHGTNSYDFNLMTVLVVDEFGEGYPTAWCISNRTDLIAML